MSKFLDGFSPNNDLVIWKIKVWFYISPLILALGIWSYFDQTKLKNNGIKTIGTITNFRTSNETCSHAAGSRTRSELCTKFFANIAYQDQLGHRHSVMEEIGDEVGHDQPLQTSNMQVGQQVKFYYDPANPAIGSSENAIGNYFGMAYGLMIAGGFFLLVGLVRLLR